MIVTTAQDLRTQCNKKHMDIYLYGYRIIFASKPFSHAKLMKQLTFKQHWICFIFLWSISFFPLALSPHKNKSHLMGFAGFWQRRHLTCSLKYAEVFCLFSPVVFGPDRITERFSAISCKIFPIATHNSCQIERFDSEFLNCD